MKLLCTLVVIVLFSAVKADVEEEGIDFEGDILLTYAQKRLIDEGKDLALEFSMERGASKSRRWPGGVMPYTIDSSLERQSRARTAIEGAMKEWTAKTCITFKPRTNEAAYVNFRLGNGGCSSYVGRIGRKQPINLSSGCWRRGIVIHEIGHALGFWHEQSRPDRDNYVTIKWDNIKSGHEHNFNMHPNSEIDSLGVPYDYGSIMHYRATAFTKNGKATIVSKPAGKTMGQRMGLSIHDAEQMRKMYKCSGGGKPPPTSKPSKPVPPTRPPTRPPTSGGNCKDAWYGCARHSSQCKTNERFMRVYCKNTCGFC